MFRLFLGAPLKQTKTEAYHYNMLEYILGQDV